MRLNKATFILRSLPNRRFSYFDKLDQKELYKPNRRLRFEHDFAKIFQISQSEKDRLNIIAKEVMFFLNVPFGMYMVLLLTHYPISISYLLGAPCALLLPTFLTYNYVTSYFNRAETIEITKNFELIKISTYDYLQKSQYSSDTIKEDPKTVIYNKEDVIDIEPIILNEKSDNEGAIKEELSSVNLILKKDDTETKIKVSLMDNELKGYNDYFQALTDKKAVKFN